MMIWGVERMQNMQNLTEVLRRLLPRVLREFSRSFEDASQPF